MLHFFSTTKSFLIKKTHERMETLLFLQRILFFVSLVFDSQHLRDNLIHKIRFQPVVWLIIVCAQTMGAQLKFHGGPKKFPISKCKNDMFLSIHRMHLSRKRGKSTKWLSGPNLNLPRATFGPQALCYACLAETFPFLILGYERRSTKINFVCKKTQLVLNSYTVP